MRNVFHSPTGLSALAVGFEGCFWLLNKSAGADAPRGLDRGIPDLHLRAAAQINAAVAILEDFPIDEQLEIAVVLGRAQAISLAVEHQGAVDDLPMVAHALVGLGLGGRQFVLRHLGPLGRIGDQALPAVEIPSIEQSHEALGRSVVGRSRQPVSRGRDDQHR